MNDYYFERDLGEGRWLYVMPLTYGRARLVIGPHKSKGWYADGY